jgi:type II secretory pathway pseudopilin PulG
MGWIRTDRSDRGMTLGEVMIASSVLLVCLTSLAGVLGMSVNSSRSARARDEAANLANAKIEYARSLAYDEVGLLYSNGAHGDPAGEILTPQQSGSYTIDTECTWVRNADGRAAYKKLVVHVSWDDPTPAEVSVTTMIYGKSDILRSGDLAVRLRYRESSNVVTNATVAIIASDNSARAVMPDSSGEAFFGQVAIGATSLSVVPPAGCLVDTASIPAVSIASDAVTTIIVFIQQPAQATIHVTDSSGVAISGASVTLRRTNGTVLPAIVTDASGDARFTALYYDDYSASVSKDGFTSAVAPLTVSIVESHPIVPVAINPTMGVGLSIRVSDTNETPIAGASVSVNSSPSQVGTSDSNGAVSFSGFSVGAYTVTVTKSGYVTHVITTYLHDGDQDALDFHMTPVVAQGSMRIVTLEHHGNTLGHARVIVSGPDGYYTDSQYTDHDGVLNLADLVPGTYTVKCYTKSDGTATAIVAAGHTSEVQISQKN